MKRCSASLSVFFFLFFLLNVSHAKAGVLLPPFGGLVDYQLGGAYTPRNNVQIISRDRTDVPASGRYNICYINGFQTQPGESLQWLQKHPDLILRDEKLRPVMDREWGEMMLDIRTAEKRAHIGRVVAGWMNECKEKGFDAIEIDNLDTFTRSKGRVSEDDAVAMMRIFSDDAHMHEMPIAQKNSVEISGRRKEMGTDFAVAEECSRYNECEGYTRFYGDHVILIEYRKRDFLRSCRDFSHLSIVYRDVPLSMPGSKTYRFAQCGGKK